MTRAEGPGQLTWKVRELLDRILQQAVFLGSDEMLGQVPNVTVVGGPMTMLELRVTRPAAPSAFKDGPAPISATVSDSAGAAIGEMLLWLEDGYLSTLEFAWWTDDPPDHLPNLDRVQVARR